MAKKKFPIVLIEWNDSSGCIEWHDIDVAVAAKPLRCKTVGAMIYRDKRKVVVVASHCEDNGSVSDRTVIPAGMVTRIRRLKQGGQ